MKFLLAAALITTAAAIPINHMELAKRAHATNEAVQTTNTKDAQVDFTVNEKTMDALNGFGEALLNIFDNKKCNEESCPMDTVSDYLSEALPGLSILATLPDRLENLAHDSGKGKDGSSETGRLENIDSFFEKDSVERTMPQINKEVVESMISAIIAPIVSAINNNPVVSAFHNPMPSTAGVPFMTKKADTNNPNGVVQFASAAGSVINDAHRAVSHALNGIFH
ncbi:hypothetical protein G6F46_006513 [Rhizopus delemar]|uniref:Uncharacterized protein n=3 Tax=Rhizopus TaxID=4842 RepID=I1BUI8_RHIO9|nr:hypothetical protein RO3G_04573 [Rhizopus delemar RA 99-880]KAG1458683.1 hypothetical protein G6F55_005201 [Rhizopus delemar]KAG1543481.1 hypothetical protein G6F51_006644 [Rhizopus arrhizus]KAG1499969.1 hypothetical protein G6F54_004045 [Rhizopus delemar]KAG1509817.1 hypothetical protein G6F52_011051 [Rhizopus delemar]|eukprot:EIE79868.1 hypothetical protein RO3G_04573 [Rhizopus delemar RA 99-880]